MPILAIARVGHDGIERVCRKVPGVVVVVGCE